MGTRLFLKWTTTTAAALFLGLSTSGCIMDIQEDNSDCCDDGTCYYCDDYSDCDDDDDWYPADTEDADSDSDTDAIDADTSSEWSDDTDADTGADTEPADTGTEELTYEEQWQCDAPANDCGETICDAIDAWNERLLTCAQEGECGCSYLEACLIVQIMCIEDACPDPAMPDASRMVSCAMDYAACLNPCM